MTLMSSNILFQNRQKRSTHSLGVCCAVSLLPAPQCGSVNAGISQRAGAFAVLERQFSLLPFALLLVNHDAVTLAVSGPIQFWKHCALSRVNTLACAIVNITVIHWLFYLVHNVWLSHCYRQQCRHKVTVPYGAQCVAVAVIGEKYEVDHPSGNQLLWHGYELSCVVNIMPISVH